MMMMMTFDSIFRFRLTEIRQPFPGLYMHQNTFAPSPNCKHIFAVIGAQGTCLVTANVVLSCSGTSSAPKSLSWT